MDSENPPCFDCGKPATWLYMPSSELPEAQRWACDEHVPRGCSCNDEPVDGNYDNADPANWKQATDNQGRKVPCCEWWPLHDYALANDAVSKPSPRVTTADMLRASEVCAHAAKDPLNRGEIASILDAASRILANTSLRPALANALLSEPLANAPKKDGPSGSRDG